MKNKPNYHQNNYPRRAANEPQKKKEHGQVFLRDQSIIDDMLNDAKVQKGQTVAEIGCGDGFLTSSIIDETQCKKLVIFEIDEEWAKVVTEKIRDPRVEMNVVNFLDVDLANFFNANDPIVLLANLPYHITFPILHKIKAQRELFSYGVVMVQEEVAQRLVGTTGKSTGSISHYFQHFFELKLLTKVPPRAFEPQPKIFSRLVSFKPRTELLQIPNEEKFWEFLKVCFKCPRQMLHNNLRSGAFSHIKIPTEMANLRAQQMTFDLFLKIWNSK